jgi:hypothetical protein
MSRTRKDSSRKATRNRILEIVKRDDSTFDIFLVRALIHSQIPERWLPDELCGRFGFCGEECDAILRDINRNGRTTRQF